MVASSQSGYHFTSVAMHIRAVSSFSEKVMSLSIFIYSFQACLILQRVLEDR